MSDQDESMGDRIDDAASTASAGTTGTPGDTAPAATGRTDEPSPRPLGDPTGGAERPGADRIFAGRYRLLGRRGRATDIALFEAVDALTDRPVALKIVHPDICAQPGFEERFVATMHDTARARHPNLTEVLDVGSSTWGGRPVHYVVCENLTGGSIRDLRDRGRHLSPSQVVMVGLDACRGLDIAHRAGLVHGDLRPANLVFGDDGRVRITDLGLARLVADVTSADTGSIDIERAKYASPEQAQGRPLGAKSDVYALCLCLLEAVTGHVPFVGDSAVATLANRVDRLLPVSADLGPLAAVFGRAGLPEPADRSSAAEFGRALHQAAEKLPRPAPLALVGGGLFSTAPAATPAPVAAVTAPDAALAPDPDVSAGVAVPDGDSGTADPGADAPDTADGDTADGDTADGDTADGDTADGDTADGDTAGGEPGGDTDGSGELQDDRRTGATAPTLLIAVTDPVASPALTAADGPVDPPVEQAAPPIAPPPVGVVAPPHAPGRPPDGEPELAAGPFVSTGFEVPPPPAPDAAPPLLREPRSRRKLIGALVVLALAIAAGGALGLWFARDTSNVVPDLVGVEQGEALNTISEFDWDITVVEEPSDEIAAGAIIGTDPAAGGRLDVDGAFTMIVSTGPAPRVLPELTGRTVDDATAALSALDLGLEVGEQPFDEVVELGAIISWMVPDQPGLVAGDTVLPDTTVVVVVSAGPSPRVVPDLTGLGLDDARAAVEGLGLVLEALPDEFSATVIAGGVARQDPAPSSEVARGATVSVAISLGPDLVAVPPLANLGVDEARAALEAAGLVLGEVKGDPAGVNVLAEVGGVSIGADASFPRGTTVDLTFEVPAPPPTEAPVDTTTPTDAAPPAP